MIQAYPLSLALFDFLPVIFFLIGAIFLVGISSIMCGRRCRNLAITGSLLIFFGGLTKAVWKLLFTIGVGDFLLLSEIQFVLVAPGFLILLIVVIKMASSERSGYKENAELLPAIATWKIPFLIVMTLSSLGVQGLLAYISFRHKAIVAAFGFILAFICLLGMGAMASGEQTLTRQWVEETVNTAGQFGFMVGCFFLYRSITRSQAA